MAIGKQMPQDIFKYEAKFIAGFSARQCVFYLSGVLVGFAMFFGAFKGATMNVRIVACAAGCLPFFLWGTVKPFGQPLEKVLVPFVEDNILAPPIRRKEKHYPEFDTMKRANTSDHAAKASQNYPAIK